MASLSVVLCLAFSVIDASQWIVEPQVLRRRSHAQAIAFLNDTLFVIGGGHNPRQWVHYNTRSKTLTDQYSDGTITINIECYGQGWVQKNESLYIIPAMGTHFVVYNLVTTTMTQWNEPNQTFPITVGSAACLAMHKNYLFVIGGSDSASAATQIYDLTENSWLSAPSLNQQRRYTACIIHPGTEILYAFGGYQGTTALSSIELLSVSDMDNIGSGYWTVAANELVPGRRGHRVAIYGNDILIIGGGITGSKEKIGQIHVFHTMDNTVEIMAETMSALNPIQYAAVLMTENNTVYTVGGYTNVTILSTIQALHLPLPPTANPTTYPSQTPTDNPTYPTGTPSEAPTQRPSYPTMGPTDNPTYPTGTPSANPTSSPTETTEAPTQRPSYPTMEPTDNPTYPTGTPSEAPTQRPTMDPTSNPTFPTDHPTMDPTSDPTQRPTMDPTSNPTTASPTYPTENPTMDPTSNPTYPTMDPTMDPTSNPTVPTMDPTSNPTQPTMDPTQPTMEPTWNPTVPTDNPTMDPTSNPTHPTTAPSQSPSDKPTDATDTPSSPTLDSADESFTPTNALSKALLLTVFVYFVYFECV